MAGHLTNMLDHVGSFDLARVVACSEKPRKS